MTQKAKAWSPRRRTDSIADSQKRSDRSHPLEGRDRSCRARMQPRSAGASPPQGTPAGAARVQTPAIRPASKWTSSHCTSCGRGWPRSEGRRRSPLQTHRQSATVPSCSWRARPSLPRRPVPLRREYKALQKDEASSPPSIYFLREILGFAEALALIWRKLFRPDGRWMICRSPACRARHFRPRFRRSDARAAVSGCAGQSSTGSGDAEKA